MGIRSNQRGGSGSGRGDNPHYTWHPSMGTPHPSEGGSGGGKKPPKTGVATGDDDDPMDRLRRLKEEAQGWSEDYDNVYDFNEFAERKKKQGDGQGYYDEP